MDINVNHIRHKLLFHTSWNNNFKRSNTFLCSQMCSHTLHLGALALFVFTDTFMRAHTPTSNTNSLHYESFWCLKSGDESCWFVCFFSTFFGPELTLQICWGGQRSREGRVRGEFVLCFKCMTYLYVRAPQTSLMNPASLASSCSCL